MKITKDKEIRSQTLSVCYPNDEQLTKLRTSHVTNHYLVKLKILPIVLMNIFCLYVSLFLNLLTKHSFCQDYKISPLLEQFCQDRVSSTDSFTVPLIAVHETGMHT